MALTREALPAAATQVETLAQANPQHQLLTLWLVLRLSTCFLNTACQKSLHRNLMISSVSPSLGLSLLYLFGDCSNGMHTASAAAVKSSLKDTAWRATCFDCWGY